MDMGLMRPEEIFQLIHQASRSVIHGNIDEKDPLPKQVCEHCVSTVNSIVSFQDLCATVQIVLRFSYTTQTEMEKGDTITQEARVVKANITFENWECTSKQVSCHSGEMIDLKHNGANGMYSNQVHSEMHKTNYILPEEHELKADVDSVKIEEDEKQKSFGGCSSDIKEEKSNSNSVGAKEIISDISTADLNIKLSSVFPHSLSPNNFSGEDFHETLGRISPTLTELKVNTVTKYIHEECDIELTDNENTVQLEQQHVDDLTFPDSKCIIESQENEYTVTTTQILNCSSGSEVPGFGNSERLNDCNESVLENSTVCPKSAAELGSASTYECAKGDCIPDEDEVEAKVTAKEEVDDNGNTENDPETVSNPDKKLRNLNKDFEGKKRHRNKDLESKPENILTCVGCEETFQVRSKLKEHCKTCDIYLIVKKQQRSKSGKKTVKTYNTRCILCDIVFPSRYRLKQHEIQVHGGALRKVGVRDETKVFRCKECTTSFHTNEELTKHKEFPEYVCQHCGTKKCSLLRLIQHEKTHTHILKYPGPHKCNICNKILSTKGNLKAHEMEHAGIRKFVCELCGKAFPSNRGLQSHKISVHTDERPFVCTQCDSAFKFERNLREHSRVHTGVKPFSCDDCGKMFRHSSSLREHRMIHTKPFKCDYCDKRFQTQHNLMEHVSSHDTVHYQHL